MSEYNLEDKKLDVKNLAQHRMLYLMRIYLKNYSPESNPRTTQSDPTVSRLCSL